MLDDENAWGVSRPETYRDFADKVKSLGGKLTKLLCDLKAQGKRIAAYGAAAKGTTLLNSKKQCRGQSINKHILISLLGKIGSKLLAQLIPRQVGLDKTLHRSTR